MTTPSLSRRTLLSLAAAGAAQPAWAQRPKTVTMLGDSITAGYGLRRDAAVPYQLQLALLKLHTPAVVRAAGVSGDTTAGGLARVDFSIQRGTDVVVVALGANDLLQGLDTKATKANLDRIIARLKARGIGVVLAGLSAPVEIGRNYARDFNAIFPAVARTHGAILYPDLLAGVARNPAFNQPDGIHPNVRGAQIIATRLAPSVAKALAARG